MMKARLILVSLLAMCAVSAHAQTLTFTVETQSGGTTGVEEVTPIATWDTEPAALGCIASGDWSGEKGASGAETLPAITQSATYNITCEWEVGGSATLSWTPPTQNTDGSALTDLDGYKIYWGTASGDYQSNVAIDNPGITTYVVDGLSSGTWFFVATALNELGVESQFSNEAMKAVDATTDETLSRGITVNPRPAAPTGLTAE